MNAELRTNEYVNFVEAGFPAPFDAQLEFSSPARGTMNIVHTGMLIPESHQIFVCAKGCLRGVVLTAAEMGAMGRYSALEIREENVLNGDMEAMIVEGVADIIAKLNYRPRAILVFISCQHFFMAYDKALVFKQLRERFQDIDFTDCYMIPTLRKSGVTPDQLMRMQLYSLLKLAEADEKQINIMGSNHALERSCEMYGILEEQGLKLTSIHDCRSYEDYLALAKGRLNIIYEPIAIPAGEKIQKELGIPYLYLPNVFRYEEIEANYKKLEETLGKKLLLTWIPREHAERAVAEARALLGDRPLAVDYTITFRLLNLVRFLLESGFNVKDVFADGFLPEEKDDFEWIRANFPEVRIHPTNRASMRYTTDLNPEAVALGQKAACFMGTDNFVNIAEGGGFFGYDGIVQLMGLIVDAAEQPKDRRAVVQRKGTKVMHYEQLAEGACCCQPESLMESTGRGATASLLPTYSSDEFGICSALYELGGMVVMHDASGCNSTYTTHDEPRWYDHESMVYISAISEAEAILGDDNKLIKDICDAAKELKPKFVAIVGAPIPYMIGTDLKAIARVLEKELGIPCYGFAANGMQGYGLGISMALAEIVKGIEPCEKSQRDKLRVNIVGATPLDYALNGSVDSMKEWLESAGFEAGCSIGMGSSLEELERAYDADVNLVVSYGGLKAAKQMKRTGGIPYVIGVPYGANGEWLAKKLAGEVIEAAEPAEAGTESARHTAVIIGEGVTAVAMAEAIDTEFNLSTKVLCATDTAREILREGDRETPSEDAVVRALAEEKPELVIADPFYMAIVPKGTEFYPMPHEAFSGRIYDGQNQNLINCRLRDKLSGLERYDA